MASRNFTQANIWTNQATIGFLGATTSKVWGEFVWAFEEQLQQLGWFDGNNMHIDYKSADVTRGAIPSSPGISLTVASMSSSRRVRRL